MTLTSINLRQTTISSLILRQVWCSALLLLLLLALHVSTFAQSQPPQSAPTVTATAGKAKITVTWNAVNNAVGYEVYRSDDGGSFYNNVTTGATTCVFSYMVGNGHTYAFYVRAYNNWGYGPTSNTASATLNLDSPGASAQPGKAKITITWNAIADADTYQISRSENGGSFYQIATNLTGTSFINTGVYNNVTYAYQVRAYNNAGYSPPSAMTSAYLNLPAPSGLSLSRASNGNVTFSWGAVTDADSYYVYKSPDGINGMGMGSVTGTSKVDTSPYSPETLYYVQAQNAAGGSPISFMISTLDGNEVQMCPSPVDKPDTAEHGSSAGDPVNLATGREAYAPAPDLTVYNPNGPGVVWQRNYLSNQALKGYGSPGFSAGWVHTYDVSVKGPATAGTWGALTLVQYTGQLDSLTPVIGGNGLPTGVLTPPQGSAYLASGIPGATTGEWQSITVTNKDQTELRFTPLSTGTYALASITNRVGRSLDLSWSSNRALVQISDPVSTTVLLSLTYDSSGRLSAATDNFGRKVVYTNSVPFGSDPGKLQSVSQVVTAATTNPPARWSFTYDTANGQQLKTIVVPSPTGSGNSTSTINYDPRGRVTSLVDANGNKRVYTYNSTSTLVQVKNPANTVVQSWTQKFNVTRHDTGITDANNKSTIVEYNDTQNPWKPTRVVDKNNKATLYTYDQYGNLLTAINPRNVTTTYTWSYTAFSLGRLTGIQEGSKPATTITYYEPSGLVQSVSTPSPTGSGSVATTFTYDALGNVLTVTTPGNNAASQITTTYNYTTDGAYTQSARIGQPITVTDNLGHVTHMRYDTQGRGTSVTDALGNETNLSYNLIGQPEEVQLPATGQTGTGRGRIANSYLYTGGPLVTTTIYDESNVQARQVARNYGSEGELLSVTGSTEPVTHTYDALYRLKTLKDGNNNTTTYSYNNVGLVSNVQMPGGQNIQFPSYDFAGNLLQRIDGNNVTTNYIYNDAESLLTDIQYPATPSLNVHFGYDSYGRRTSATDSTGSHSYSYGNTDELQSATTTYTGLTAQTISYAYNANGSRQSMTTPAGTFSYSYDAAGRGSSITNPFAETSSWTYFNNNWMNTQTLGNGAQTTYSYNALGQMIDLVNKTGGGATLSQFNQMAHDGAGNRTSLTASIPAVPSLSGTTSYSYDSKNQLTQEQTTRNGSYTYPFVYDAAGNPTGFKGTTKTYNSNNLQTATGMAYDGNGNPTTYSGATLTFDAENRLMSHGTALTAGYRGDGLRAWKQTAGGRTYFLYDGTSPVVELDALGAVSATNTFGAHGLISRRGGLSSTFYTFDPQGSVVQRLDVAGAIQSTHHFTAHGAELTAAAVEPFGYKAQWGYYTDRETGLLLLTHRYYDPNSGRFLTRDPIGHIGGVNLYTYVTNNPGSFKDPTGHIGLLATGAIGAVAGGVLGAGASILSQTLSGSESINWHQVGNAAVSGAIAGGLAGLGGYGVASMMIQGLDGIGHAILINGVVGAIAGGIGQAVADIIAPPGRFITDPGEAEARIAASCTWGALGGAIGGGISRPLAGIVVSNGIGAGSQTPYNPGPSRLPSHPWY
jgi:RHS repeat-associated protein